MPCLLVSILCSCRATDEGPASSGSEADRHRHPLPIDEAIQIVDGPSEASNAGNMSPFELQVYYRLRYLLVSNYTFEGKHAEKWLECVHDTKRNMYARLCAAYFLLDKHEEARQFIISQLQSQDLRHRYNAAKVVEMHAARNPHKTWDVDVLIQSLADGSLDGGGVGCSPDGEHPQGDRDDIMETPMDDICWSLGSMKEKKAVPALISVLERKPRTGGAAFALGEIGDPRAIPILLKVLTDHSGYENREVTALGRLKCKEAVPILVSRLGRPETISGGLDIMETETILEALLEIGDPQAVAPIGQFLQEDHPAKTKAVARRVLVQLKSSDPVKDLLALLDRETYEPERSDIITALARHRDSRVIQRLADIARTSESAFMRREAIFGLRDIGDRDSLLILASLLDATWSKNLKSEWGWKGKPDFESHFPETIQMCLEQATKQDFGKDRKKWEDWIRKNINPR